MKKNAFTLIELLITISIIAALSAIGLTLFRNVQAQARDSLRKSDLQKLATALEIYYQQNNKYIVNLDGSDMSSCQTNPATSTFYTSAIKDKMSDGIVPADPATKLAYCYISLNQGQAFRLFAQLDSCSDPNNPICSSTNHYNYSVVSDNTIIAVAPNDTLVPTPAPTTPAPAPTSSPTSAPTTTTQTLTLFSGTNWIGLTVDKGPNYLAEDFLKDLNATLKRGTTNPPPGGHVTQITYWDSSKGNWGDVHTLGSADNNFVINLGTGYVVTNNWGGNSTITGTNPSLTSLSIPRSSSLISFPRTLSGISNAQDLLQSMHDQGIDVRSITKWEGGKFVSYSYNSGSSAFRVYPGIGYMIRSYTTATKNYTLP